MKKMFAVQGQSIPANGKNGVRRNADPVWTLILLIPFLTEILSGNMMMSEVFTVTSLFMLSIAYGMAVVLIRELAVRWRLGIEGLFVLGLAYGIYNEGLCAKTLLMNNGVVTESFGHYPLTGGVNLAWASFILVWHACHSVLYPLWIIHYLNQDRAGSPWLGRKQIGIFAGLVAAVGTLAYFYNPNLRADAGHFWLFVGGMSALVALSRVMPRTYPSVTGGYAGYQPVLLGMSLFGYTLSLFILGNIHAPAAIMFLWSALCAGLWLMLVSLKGWLSLRSLVLIALGNYLSDSIFLTLGGLTNHSGQRTAAGLMLIIALIISIRKIIAGREAKT